MAAWVNASNIFTVVDRIFVHRLGGRKVEEAVENLCNFCFNVVGLLLEGQY